MLGMGAAKYIARSFPKFDYLFDDLVSVCLLAFCEGRGWQGARFACHRFIRRWTGVRNDNVGKPLHVELGEDITDRELERMQARIELTWVSRDELIRGWLAMDGDAKKVVKVGGYSNNPYSVRSRERYHAMTPEERRAESRRTMAYRRKKTITE